MSKDMGEMKGVMGGMGGQVDDLSGAVSSLAAKGAAIREQLKGGVAGKIGGLFKRGSVAGQDLRSAKGIFPTDDSKAKAGQLLNDSQKSAEVGPTPSIGQLAPTGPTVQTQSVQGLTQRGSLPKLAGVIMIESDPLVQYLKKHAAVLEQNIDDMPTDDETQPQAIGDTDPDSDTVTRSNKARKDVLDDLFDNEHKPPRLVSS
jgi:hypothetical protein